MKLMPMVLAALFVACTLVPLSGWAVQTSWQWFVVPLGAPPIGFWQAAGLDLLVTFMAYVPTKEALDPGEKAGRLLGYMYLRPLTVIGIGWLLAKLGGLA